ncbi:MAG: hypothetical protein V4489_01330 [Chlamydiota bacterium]
MKPTVFLFGESEKGEFGIPLICQSLPELCDTLGNPPEESQGMFYAIQTLLYSKQLLFCRVQEEGFSVRDYIRGLELIKSEKWAPQLQAILIPGVGDEEIVDAAMGLCNIHNSLLVLTEKDLYDYLVGSHPIIT